MMRAPHPSPAVDPESNGGHSAKRRKLASPPRWTTDAEQRLYSSSLLAALRRLRRPASRSHVRAAADRALASAARGSTRWSRAILRRGGGSRRPSRRAGGGGGKCIAGGDGKVRALGRVVPGCGRLGLGRLLEETADYVAALEMQVRSLAAIYHVVSVAGGDGGGGLGC